MTPVQYLRSVGCAEAREIADAIGLPLESVYLSLVAAEARGWAKVKVEYCGKDVICRYWEALT
jgi:hypothetical protein